MKSTEESLHILFKAAERGKGWIAGIAEDVERSASTPETLEKAQAGLLRLSLFIEESVLETTPGERPKPTFAERLKGSQPAIRVLKNTFIASVRRICTTCKSELEVTLAAITERGKAFDIKQEEYEVDGFNCPCCAAFNQMPKSSFYSA